MRIESGFAEVNGTKIYYEKMGTGNPLNYVVLDFLERI